MAKNTNSQFFFSFSEKWIFGHNLGFSNSVWRSSTVASGTSTLILKLVWTGATMDGAIFNSQTRRSPVTLEFVISKMDNLTISNYAYFLNFHIRPKMHRIKSWQFSASNYDICYDFSTFWRTLRYVKKLKIVMILQLLTYLTLRQIVEKSWQKL